MNKVVLEGDPGVGKTTIFQRFETDAFLADDWRLGREEKRCEKEWAIGNRQVSMTLVDQPDPYYLYDEPYYYKELLREAKVSLFVYSIDEPYSINNIRAWIDNVTVYCYDSTMITAIVGNKCDLEEERQVPPEWVKDMAMNYDIDPDLVFEISAKTGEGFQEMFDVIALKMATLSPPQNTPTPHYTPTIPPLPTQDNKKCIIQ